jgi:hypothetical protein
MFRIQFVSPIDTCYLISQNSLGWDEKDRHRAHKGHLQMSRPILHPCKVLHARRHKDLRVRPSREAWEAGAICHPPGDPGKQRHFHLKRDRKNSINTKKSAAKLENQYSHDACRSTKTNIAQKCPNTRCQGRHAHSYTR